MARNWPHLPKFQSKEEAIAFVPEGWGICQIEGAYEKLDTGKLFDQKTSFSSGRVPVLAQSADGVVGFHNEEPGVDASPETPVVTFANHTCEMRVMRKPFSVIQNVFPMVGRPGVCETDFFYYATKGRVYLEEYKGHFPDYRRLWIPLPPLPTQRAIAHVLGTLDDLIELNRETNEILEEMARTLFKSWFVDFDPVRAKLEGRPPAGMDASTAALFPDHFQDSELGQIPKGWEVKPIGEIVVCVGGGTPSTSEPKFWEDGVHHWTTPKDFSSLQAPFLIDTDRRITDAGLAKISSGLLPVGTVLMSSRAPVGYLAVADIPVAINQGFIAMRPNKSASNYFLLNWCQSNMIEIENRASGTTFAEISKSAFRPIPLILPPAKVMEAFTECVEPFYSQIASSLRESRDLATLRDTLLPKLLSGEVSVPVAEELIVSST